MNIGIDISQAVYEGTGSARYVDHLVKGLAGNRRAFSVTLFGSALKKRALLDTYTSLGVTTKFFPLPPRFFEMLWNQVHVVPFEQFAGRVDIYHSSDWTQAPSRAKKVTTVHDLIPFLFPEYVHPRIRAAHKDRWKWIIREVNHIIVDAECTKNDIRARFDYPSDNITVIPLGVESRFLEQGTRKNEIGAHQGSIFDGYGITAQSYILAVGTLEPRKNIQQLISAYGRLPVNLRELYPLVLVGKKAWAESFVLPENARVIFTGYVDDDALPYLYAGAKLFVMPSKYEGFGFPVLEAMATKTPVLASRLSSLPEVGGETIHYFNDIEDDKEMSRDLENALLAYSDTMIDQAYTRASGMTWDKTVAHTIKVYEKMMG